MSKSKSATALTPADLGDWTSVPLRRIALDTAGADVCTPEQRGSTPEPTLAMQCGLKTVIAMLWVSAVSTAGIAGNLNSFSSWTVLAGIAVLPPLVMMRRWNPRQSMSPSIQEALR